MSDDVEKIPGDRELHPPLVGPTGLRFAVISRKRLPAALSIRSPSHLAKAPPRPITPSWVSFRGGITLMRPPMGPPLCVSHCNPAICLPPELSLSAMHSDFYDYIGIPKRLHSTATHTYLRVICDSPRIHFPKRPTVKSASQTIFHTFTTYYPWAGVAARLACTARRK